MHKSIELQTLESYIGISKAVASYPEVKLKHNVHSVVSGLHFVEIFLVVM